MPGKFVLSDTAVLLAVDVQRAFDDPSWGARNNPAMEENGLRLLAAWRGAGRPLMHAKHNSTEPGSTLAPGAPGNAFKPGFEPATGEALVEKTVTSAFVGTGLEADLRRHGLTQVVVFGITADMCVSTTVRVGHNLGFNMAVVSDACATFDQTSPDGEPIAAALLHQVHLTTLNTEFAVALRTADVQAALGPAPAAVSQREHREMEPWIQLNAAGASPSPPQCTAAYKAHLDLELRVGGYQAEADVGGGAPARAALAALLGVAADEIAILGGAQHAWSSALASVALGPADRIVLCSESEYAGNVVGVLQKQQANRCALEVLRSSADGTVDLKALRAALDPAGAQRSFDEVTVVCLCHVNTSCGIVQDAAAVGEIVAGAREKGAQVVFVLDACQSFGQLPVDVRAWGVDYACGTGRKWLRGPRGTGFLYARAGTHALGEPALLDHCGATWAGGDSRDYEVIQTALRFELWEHNVAACMGLAAAVSVALDAGIEAIAAKSLALATRLRQGLAPMDGVVLCDGSKSYRVTVCAMVFFHANSVMPASELKARLADEHRIAVSASDPATHSLAADGSPPRALSGAVRVSPHVFNTEAEIDAALAAVQAVLASASAARAATTATSMVRKRGASSAAVAAMPVADADKEAVLAAARVKRKQAEMEASSNCPTCWMPRPRCVCAAMPPLQFDTNVELIVYIHNLELYNAGDDAKILLRAAPERTSLYVYGREGDDKKLRAALCDGHASSLLLFPDEGAMSAAEAKETHLCFAENADGPPLRIVVLDGTWKQVKTMLKHLTKNVLGDRLSLPHVKLSPETLSVYARTQTQPDRICTIEALALFLQNCGERQATVDALVQYVVLNNAALRSAK